MTTGRSPIRYVVLGSGGLLGTPLSALLGSSGDIELHALRHADLDITQEPRVRALLAALRPDVVINCAAFTRVDECERQAELAMSVNGRGAEIVAAAARAVGARFVHVSTDYVFDGSKAGAYVEEDVPGPETALSAYGRSKLAGERAVQAAGGDWLIVRTSWVFGPAGPNFVATILNLARTNPELRVVSDQRGRPTYAPDLAEAIVALTERSASGVVHVANSGVCTWYDLARQAVALAGLPAQVRPCTTAEFPRPARRPANSVLDTTRFETIVGRPLRGWMEALGAYVEMIRA